MKDNKHDEYCSKDITGKCDCYVENDNSFLFNKKTFPNDKLIDSNCIQHKLSDKSIDKDIEIV